MILNTELLPDFNLTRELLNIIGRKLKCCQDNKGFYCCGPTNATVSIKLIQISCTHIKLCEELDHHHVVTLTLKCKRWNLTT